CSARSAPMPTGTAPTGTAPTGTAPTTRTPPAPPPAQPTTRTPPAPRPAPPDTGAWCSRLGGTAAPHAAGGGSGSVWSGPRAGPARPDSLGALDLAPGEEAFLPTVGLRRRDVIRRPGCR